MINDSSLKVIGGKQIKVEDADLNNRGDLSSADKQKKILNNKGVFLVLFGYTSLIINIYIPFENLNFNVLSSLGSWLGVVCKGCPHIFASFQPPSPVPCLSDFCLTAPSPLLADTLLEDNYRAANDMKR